MRTKRILSLMLVVLTLVVMPGCLGSRYQNSVDKSLLIQENLQLDQALSLTQYRLQLVEQENEQLRQRLGQGTQQTGSRSTNIGQPTPLDMRQRSFTQPTLAPPVPPMFQQTPNQTPQYQKTDIPGVMLPAPNQPGDVPAVFQTPQSQNRNRSLPLPQKVPSGRTPNEMTYRSQQYGMPLYLPSGDVLTNQSLSPNRLPYAPQLPIMQVSGVSDKNLVEPTSQNIFPAWSPYRE